MSLRGTMWGGRFELGTDGLVQEFSESVSYDWKLYKQDIAGSKAHAKMLAKQGVISKAEAEALVNGLEQVAKEIEEQKFVWKKSLEDVHMNIEHRLTEIVGDVGKKLHTGRSRNDQVALDYRLYISDRIRAWDKLLKQLISTLCNIAESNINTYMPGYTHLQPAQPISLAQHMLAYAAMFKRDSSRIQDCDKRVRICPLGAAALAGTTYNLDPEFVAEELGMYGIFQNSMDAVSDRDFVAEACFIASTIAMHLSRACEDIIIWANPLFGFIKLPDAYSTGSSIMPQKKNPDVAELIRGKTGRVYAALINILSVLKGLPMTYNRDLQEDKEPFFDVDNTISNSIELMAGMLDTIKFIPEKMNEALEKGFLNATELADYLVSKGVPFRQAHHYTGEIVSIAEKNNLSIEKLPLETMKSVYNKIEQDVYHILKYEVAVSRRNTPGGTGESSVKKQINDLKKWLSTQNT